MVRNILRALCFVYSFCVLVAGATAYAQSGPINSDIINGYGLRNLENAVIIHASPSTPGAGDTVHFTAESPIYNLAKDTINWQINGKNVASGIGVTSADATVDAKGDTLDVIISVDDPVWGFASNELTIVPLQVDILYDAPTYVPPFYRGRAMPGAGSSMHVQALARLSKNGTPIPNSSITYTWSRSGTVLGNISGLGKSQITIDAPYLFGSDTISVRASASDDTVSANASVTISDASPVLALYEDHPLFGITYFNALPNQISAPGEMTVAVVPYFAAVTGLDDPTLQYTWLLNDAPFAASSTKQSEVTVDPAQNSTKLHLDLTSAKNFFFSTSADWNFLFGNSGGSSNGKPGSSDAFHNSQL